MDGMTTSRADELADALAALRARLDAAASAAGRASGEIELLPVTKFFPASDIIELHEMGCAAFGESREQEASNKVAEVAAALPSATIRWHMIGRVQRNKSRAVAGWAHAVHAVDGAALAAALDRGAQRALDEGRRTTRLEAYVQISLDGDPARGGVDIGRPDLVDELCDAVSAAAGLDLVGLMAIAPRAGTTPLPAAPRSLGGHVQRPRGGGQTWIHVCACRNRAHGTSTVNVSLSSHSSHIFITDNRAHQSSEGSSDEHTA
jgi:uncharacterized pyridoxal phosphate-containing UPF0001 family protein